MGLWPTFLTNHVLRPVSPFSAVWKGNNPTRTWKDSYSVLKWLMRKLPTSSGLRPNRWVVLAPIFQETKNRLLQRTQPRTYSAFLVHPLFPISFFWIFLKYLKNELYPLAPYRPFKWRIFFRRKYIIADVKNLSSVCDIRWIIHPDMADIPCFFAIFRILWANENPPEKGGF